MNQAHITNSFPLSPMQLGMLFNYLKEPHSGIDIEQIVVHLPEIIDVLRLQRAWQWLTRRHDILRARFVWEDTPTPLQQIVSEVELPFSVFDSLGLSAPERAEKLKSFLEQDREAAFDLSQAPLLRLALIRWSDSCFSLVWTFHHALLDGRCYAILLREVFEVYEELGAGNILARPEPPPYEQYIAWLLRKDFAADEPFWKELLSGFASPVPLPVERLRGTSQGKRPHGELWGLLDAGTTGRLKEVARNHELTLNTVVMGAWATLLHRYSGFEDIVFGATRACRNSSVPQAEQTVGLFINTVPVRFVFSERTTVLSMLKALRSQWVAMRPHEHTPLSRVKSLSTLYQDLSSLTLWLCSKISASMPSCAPLAVLGQTARWNYTNLPTLPRLLQRMRATS